MGRLDIMPQSIFTEKDESIYKETSSDPLGMRVIWTFFGQKVFEQRLTTVATDIRNYTINLMNYAVLFDLDGEIEHYAITNGKKKEDVTLGILIMLEDILSFSLIEANEAAQPVIDMTGILGRWKGANRFNKEHQNPLIQINKNAGILKRQIGLGVNGRYKGPFINMGLINTDYNFRKLLQKWTEIKQTLSTWEEMKCLIDKYTTWIKAFISTKETLRTTNTMPSIFFKEVPSEIKASLVACFKDQQQLPKSIKEFWIDQLGFGQGASQAIYQAINLKDFNYQTAILQSKKALHDPKEITKIENISQIEPFLSNLQYAFDWVNYKKINQLDDQRLLSIAAEILNRGLTISPLLLYKIPRLRQLHTIIKEASPDTFWRRLLAYHTSVMKDRGAGPWLTIEHKKIRHYNSGNRPSILLKEYDFDDPPWQHSYYLYSVLNLKKGLTSPISSES